jgi:hypothetical protein
MPWLAGAISGDVAAYRYLNTSIEQFPAAQAVCTMLRSAGFVDVSAQPLTFGAATLYEARKPVRAVRPTTERTPAGVYHTSRRQTSAATPCRSTDPCRCTPPASPRTAARRAPAGRAHRRSRQCGTSSA